MPDILPNMSAHVLRYVEAKSAIVRLYINHRLPPSILIADSQLSLINHKFAARSFREEAILPEKDMESHQHQHGGRVDEYGNPIPETHGHSAGTGGYSLAPGEYGTGTGSYGTNYPHEGVVAGGGHMQAKKEHHGNLHRSGSSSSSSEDDGQGGRRKKGMKEKIKEKLPGGHKQEEHGHMGGGTTTHVGGATTTHMGGATATHDAQHEQKGIMDKIKEKLPGHH